MTLSALNKSRGLEVRRLQQELAANGYPPGPIDGIFGKLTERALVQYQGDHGLPVSGVLDEATEKSLGYAAPPMLPVPIWAHTMRYIFADPEEWVARAQDIGLSGVIVTVNSIDGKWRAKEGDLLELGELMRSAGLKVGALAYPEPHGGRELAALCSMLEPELVSIDLEENWRGRGIAWDIVGAQVVQEFRDAMPDARIGITSITYRGTDPTLEGAIAAADFVHPQAMASNKVGPDRNGDGKPDWRSIPPGRAQLLAVSKYGDHDKPHALVLAAYGQSGIPGHTPESALRRSFETAIASQAEFVSYWDLLALRKVREHLPWR